MLDDKLAEVSQSLYRHLLEAHWNGESLTGPDPGIRFNARIGRFVKNYVPWLPWRDQLVYQQAQACLLYTSPSPRD